jgi:quercetin dioxygenase-like cupin family protein
MTKEHDPSLLDDPELGRALAELERPVPAPLALRARLLSSVASPRLRYAPFFSALQRLFDLDEDALAQVFERAASPASWESGVLPNASLLHLQGGPRVTHADNGLVRVAAGARFPLHRHVGLERVVILEGGYRDEPGGSVHLPGDWHEMAPGSSHAYVALPERDLLLAASVVGGIELLP